MAQFYESDLLLRHFTVHVLLNNHRVGTDESFLPMLASLRMGRMDMPAYLDDAGRLGWGRNVKLALEDMDLGLREAWSILGISDSSALVPLSQGGAGTGIGDGGSTARGGNVHIAGREGGLWGYQGWGGAQAKRYLEAEQVGGQQVSVRMSSGVVCKPPRRKVQALS